MADFDLTQTDQQVQKILNDGQKAMGAGAQTTLTTEYVMLKDKSGVYHKILKSSFTEAIRDVLAGLLVNNDKGTTISQIAAIASGDFGSITPANLASVLGDAVTIESANYQSMLNSWKSGWYYVKFTSNVPSNMIDLGDGWWLVHVIYQGTSNVFFKLENAAKNTTRVYYIQYNRTTLTTSAITYYDKSVLE